MNRMDSDRRVASNRPVGFMNRMDAEKKPKIHPSPYIPLGFAPGGSSDLLRHQSHGVRSGYGRGHSCSGYKYTNLGKKIGHSQELHYHYSNSGYKIGEKQHLAYEYDNDGNRLHRRR